MTHAAEILIVDDDAGTRESLRDVLELQGHTVQTAEHGRGGLERLAAESVDAVIVDLRLPDISGIELLRAIKASSPATEVVIITGHASLATAMQAINGAAYAYVTKPVEMDQLLAVLDRAVERRRLSQALRESEERYRLVTESIADAIFLLDADGTMVLGNSRAIALTGYREDELRGRSILTLLTPGGAREAQARMAAVAAGERTSRIFETALVRADGSTVLVEATLSTIVKEDRIVGHLGVARDITERKRVEAELARQREALLQREKLVAMGELLAGVAHELNNPLAVVVGQSALLRQALGEGPLATRAEKIVQAAERSARIVRNFLALARQHPPERREVRLNAVVRESMELLAYQLRIDDVAVELDLVPDLPAIWADPHQLQQVLVNLVTNAYQAMHEVTHPRRLTIATRFDPGAGRVLVDVADTGPGIQAAAAERIFEPFFTTKPKGEGTGLGLSICQGIVEGHGGTIRVTQRPGHGAVFVVELPFGTPPAARARAAAEPAPIVRGRTILVVDDEAAVAEVLADFLHVDDHDVDTAANGALALERIGARDYDVILCDLRMPELDGPGFYRELERRRPALARRVVFMTGDALGPETRHFLEHTNQPTVSKPFELSDVRRAIGRALADR